MDRKIGIALAIALGVSALSPVTAKAEANSEKTAAASRTKPPVLPRVRDRIGLAQVFDNKVPPELRSKMLAKRDIVWGAISPGSPTFTTFYIPYDRDPTNNSLMRDDDWYRQNHPGWMVYKCDRKALANSFSYSTKDGKPYYLRPIDISNPDVRRYYLEKFVVPKLASGYKGIAFDNVSPSNEWGRCGVFDANGTWRQQFTGATKDPKFTEAVRDWLAWMRVQIHAIGGRVIVNLKYSADRDISDFERVAAEADVVLVEGGGFIRKCRPAVLDKYWVLKFQTLRRIAKERGLIMLDWTCEKFSDVPPALMQWSIANYLLIKGDYSYLAATPFNRGVGDYGNFEDRPELYAPIGAPVEEPRQAGSVWVRRFTNGLAVVNPSGRSPGTVSLDGESYRDLQGRVFSGTTGLPPAAGLVLLRQSR